MTQTKATTKQYKIGDQFSATYEGKPFPGPIPGQEIGKRVAIFNQEKTVKLAVFVVEKWEGEAVSGRIINTYGHKRGRSK